MSLSDAAALLGTTHNGSDTSFSGCSIDSRLIEPGQLFIAFKGEHVDGHDFVAAAHQAGARAALLEHSIDYPLARIITDNNRQAMAVLARHWRYQVDVPVVAITGSNGKSTVKEMVHTILQTKGPVCATQGNLNNELGVPLTLFQLTDSHQFAVVEMGANHPGEIAVHSKLAAPTVALITNCAPAHLAGFGSVSGVAEAKAEIYEGLDTNGTAVINADSAFSGMWQRRAARFRQITFAIEADATVRAFSIRSHLDQGVTEFVLQAEDEVCDVTLPLLGRHNVMNALAAVAATRAVCKDIELPVIAKQFAGFQGLQGRLVRHVISDGALLLDDSYNANPGSLAAALALLAEYPRERWLVLADMGELGETSKQWHHAAGEQAKSHGVTALFSLGAMAEHAALSFGKGGRAYSDSKLLIDALRAAIHGDVVILVKGSRCMQSERIVKALREY